MLSARGPNATIRWKTGGRSSYWLVSRLKRRRLTCYVEAHNTTLVAFRDPVDGISGQVADDGDFVHLGCSLSGHDDGGTA
jgi:hypothetical protein